VRRTIANKYTEAQAALTTLREAIAARLNKTTTLPPPRDSATDADAAAAAKAGEGQGANATASTAEEVARAAAAEAAAASADTRTEAQTLALRTIEEIISKYEGEVVDEADAEAIIDEDYMEGITLHRQDEHLLKRASTMKD
jgi:hypothetical protein